MEPKPINAIEIPKVLNVLTIQFGGTAQLELLYEFPGEQTTIVPRIGEIVIDSQDNFWEVSRLVHTYIIDKVSADGREVNLLKHGIIVMTVPASL